MQRAALKHDMAMDHEAENPESQRAGPETPVASVIETELENEEDSDDVEDTDAKKIFTKEELELARRIYDENRHYVFIAPGMYNQVHRNGFLSKKTLDGDGYTRAHGSNNYYRDSRPNTPSGSIIIHKDDVDPSPGNCNTFIHPTYGSEIEYRGEKDMDYAVDLTLAQLATGSNNCGFCSILYQGIQSQREFWILEWARCRWMDTYTYEDLKAAGSSMPWIETFADEVVRGKDIDESEVFLRISFPKGHPFVGVHMTVKPHSLSRAKRRRPLVDVELYTAPGLPSKWAAFGPAPHIHPEVISNDSLEQLSSWIDDCKASHQSCNKYNKIGMPSRLLSVVGMDDDDLPIIRLEDTVSTREYQYVALSHVWSFTSPLRTTLENMPKHQQGIPWDDLSIGLRETVILTMCLGMTHMWIDSLCIIQDSSQDWELESPRMGLIYSSAAVVFAAHGPKLGFQKAPIVELRDSEPSRKDVDNPIHARLKINHANIFSAPTDTNSWFGRGWCLQERFFARRLLHFGGYCEEIFFECNTGTKCECSRSTEGLSKEKIHSLKSRLNNALVEAMKSSENMVNLDELWRAYILVCEDYTARGLTYGSDTLPAISSLMAQFSPMFGAYHAGMWEKYIILSLQWESLDTQHCHRHKEFVAPSWSWASRSGAAIWYMDSTSLGTSLPTSATHEFATIVNISCTVPGADPYGKVSEGRIILRGYVTVMKISSTQPLIPDGRMEMRKEGMNGKNEECYVTFDVIEDAQETTEGEYLTCLDIMRDKNGLHGNFVSGLVLRHVDDTGGVYKRVGFSTMKAEHFAGSEMLELTII